MISSILLPRTVSKPCVAKFPFLAPGSPSLRVRAIEIWPSKRDFKRGRGGEEFRNRGLDAIRFESNAVGGKGNESIREECGRSSCEKAERERERERKRRRRRRRSRANRRCPSLEVISISSLGHRGKVDFCLLCHSWSTFDLSPSLR